MPGVREVAEAAADRTADVVPAPTAALVRSCAHDAWAPLLREHAYRSETVDLPQARALARRRRAASKPGRTRSGRRDTSNIRRCVEAHQEFVDYLLADGVQLRSNSTALPVRTAPDPLLADESAFTAEDETEDEDGDAVPRFPHVEAAINAAIARLGGAVLPKLNWSAPKDAVWVSTSGSLRCSNAEEVVLLLKSSDAIAHDLCYAYAQCADVSDVASAPATPPQLVLKQWFEVKPAMEFRCFVRRGRLVGVCQRHTADYFPFLSELRSKLSRDLDAFHDDHVADTFPHTEYTYDLYVTTRGTVRVLDFNPWGGATLPLLFSWGELARIDDTEGEGEDDWPAVRLVESPTAIRPGLRTGVPLELYDTSAGSALQEFIARHRDDAVLGGNDS